MMVLKFGAAWCPGCIIMKPRWAEIEKENPWLETEYFEYDENLPEVKKYNIDDKLPVFVFLDKSGQEFMRLTGETAKKEILDILEKNKDR